MRDSIIFSSIRAFFVALFAMIGICFGFIFLFIVIAALAGTSTTDLDTTFTQTIVANADGQRKSLAKEAPVILKINIDGVIGMDSLTMQNIRRMLIESREGSLANDRVKAILLSINTPGGTVVDADGIYHALKEYKERYKVPVYAYVDGMCASGGMYVACAADKIFATDVSIVGSVGVIAPPFLNFSQLIEKVGVKALTLSAGKGKDDLDPLRPWRSGEEAPMQDLINYYYERFVDIVTTNRPEVSKEKLIQDYGARVFTPPQAQEYGFINASGYNLSQTLKLLLKQIGIEDDYYQVIELQRNTWYSELFKSEWSLLKGKVVHQFDLGSAFDTRLSGHFLYLYRPEG